MNKSTKAILIVSVLWLVITCLCGYFSMYRPGIATRWQQEPTPPESIARLELGGASEVLAITSNGAMYQLNYGSPSNWELVSAPTGSPSTGKSCKPSENTTKIVFPPIAKVISQVRVDCVIYETAIHLEVVLLENGEIWSWEYDSYAYTELFLASVLFLCFITAMVLFMIGLGMMIYQKFKTSE